MVRLSRLIPELTVQDLEKSINFYCKVLGFQILYERPENRFAMIDLEGAQLMLEEMSKAGWQTAQLQYPFGRGVNFEIGVTQIEPIYERVLEAGLRPYRELTVNEYRIDAELKLQKEFLVQDPDGYLLRFCLAPL